MRSVGSVELLDPDGAEPGEIRRTGVERIGGSCLFDGERVIAAGGLCAKGQVEAELIATPMDGSAPARIGSLCVARYLHGEIALGKGQWLLAGGLVTAGDGLCATGSVERIDVRSGRAEPLPDLPFATAEPLAVALGGGRVLVAGGYDDEVTTAAAVLELGHGAWRAAPPLIAPRAACCPPVALDDRHVLFAGGCSSFDAPSCRDSLVLDTAALSWQRADIDMLAGAALIQVAGGLFAAGGLDEGGEPTARCSFWTWTIR